MSELDGAPLRVGDLRKAISVLPDSAIIYVKDTRIGRARHVLDTVTDIGSHPSLTILRSKPL